MNATISLPYQNFKDLENEVSRLRAENAQLKRDARKSNPHGGDGLEALDRMEAALRYALPIVQFAVANLNPETYRGWPHEELRKLAALLPETLPTWTEIDVLSLTLREAARAASDVDGHRVEQLRAAEALLTDE